METITDLTIADNRYMNRELSWLQFNRRVLQEAEHHSTPLLEKMKFLSIVSTNLDEFVSIRVAGIMDKVKSGDRTADFTGYVPEALLRKSIAMINTLVEDQYKSFHQVCGQLKDNGIMFTDMEALDSAELQQLEEYYMESILPVLTPLAVDRSRPFPLLRSKSIYIAVILKQRKTDPDSEAHLALVEIPANLPRYIEVSSTEGHPERRFILIEALIKQHIHRLFTQYVPVSLHAFRLTRNADLTLDEEGAEDLLDEMERALQTRRWGAPVRLELENSFNPHVLKLLEAELEIDDDHLLLTSSGPIDLSFLMDFSFSLSGYDHLKYPAFNPIYPQELSHADFFSVLRSRDVMVFHPYESFDCVNDFVQQAANDPSVLAIKMTLYRSNGDSHIIQALSRAAEMGKQVTVVVELKARFDEARNIEWARKLEQAGCHVVFGLAGLKIHAKMTLVVRREAGSLQRYVHVATGNYNEVSARIFTDIGLFTSNPQIGEDVANLFNKITGFAVPSWNCLSVAPTHLKQQLFQCIQREAEHASAGKPARMIAKMNALSNREMIDMLYSASQAGVHIDLIVRGICCLRPGIPGLSENITVRSIVDRFLEHSRIFYFENDGSPQIWLSSADMMTRNLDRRIELMCPVSDTEQKSLLFQLLSLLLEDNVRARQLLSDGQYRMVDNEAPRVRSQSDAKLLIDKKNRLADRPQDESSAAGFPFETYADEQQPGSVMYH
ncbi:polyphosphate kinase 1 [Paenibacillus sp. NPDC056579]|uniref:polyphosphate kinase 1 n=1 Tax=Paenibacillus sp. NPDC056579 TaxID=3345871 RepID=UPI003678AB90